MRRELTTVPSSVNRSRLLPLLPRLGVHPESLRLPLHAPVSLSLAESGPGHRGSLPFPCPVLPINFTHAAIRRNIDSSDPPLALAGSRSTPYLALTRQVKNKVG